MCECAGHSFYCPHHHASSSLKQQFRKINLHCSRIMHKPGSLTGWQCLAAWHCMDKYGCNIIAEANNARAIPMAATVMVVGQTECRPVHILHIAQNWESPPVSKPSAGLPGHSGWTTAPVYLYDVRVSPPNSFYGSKHVCWLIAGSIPPSADHFI